VNELITVKVINLTTFLTQWKKCKTQHCYHWAQTPVIYSRYSVSWITCSTVSVCVLTPIFSYMLFEVKCHCHSPDIF